MVYYNNLIYSDPESILVSTPEPTPYDNTTRMAELEAARLASYAATTEARAASDPLTNPLIRPDAIELNQLAAETKGSEYIYYYSWIGGAATGEWRLYRAPNTPENQIKYGSRVFGGETQATLSSAVGAQALKVQPYPIYDDQGNLTGWQLPDGSISKGLPSISSGTSGSSTGALGSSLNVPGYGGKLTATLGGASAGTGTAVGGQYDYALEARKSAYSLLYEEFSRYGLGALVEPLRNLITEGISPSEFTLRLRETDAYKKRFAANSQRVNKGLRALSEAEYIQLEDQYQNIMRNYGLPASYYSRGDMGVQQGFEKFIANDVSAVELEDRLSTAYNRVINAAPEVSQALRQFYPDITNGDILAYALDPEQALLNIKRKVTAAEIGAGALVAGLETGVSRAEQLQQYGVTGDMARQGYQTIGSYLPRASTLSDIYAKQGLGQYTQTTAEQEVFGLPSSVEAANKRRKLVQLEQAAFSGSSGMAGSALSRDRAGAF